MMATATEPSALAGLRQRMWRARRWAGRCLAALPVSSRWLGPPKGYHERLRHFLTTENQQRFGVGRAGAELESQPVVLAPPRFAIGPCARPYPDAPQRYESLPLRAYRAPGFRAFARPFTLIAPDDRYIWELSSYVGEPPEQHFIFHQLRLGAPERVRGRTLFLHHTTNYFHFLHDGLLQLRLLQLAGQRWDDFDHIVMPTQPAPFQLALADFLGLDRKKFLAAPASGQWAFDDLWLGDSCWNDFSAPSRFAALRGLFAGAPSRGEPAPRRLYITRASATVRRVLNEAELIALLRPLGFEVVALETLPVFRQMELFREAEIIVAGAGAGLTNLAFCRPDTRVLCFTTGFVEGYELWWAYSALNQLRYYVVHCGEAPAPGENLYHADQTVELSRFRAALDRLLAED